MMPARPNLVERACWCGADALDSFSEFYRLCTSCGTLVSQFNQGANVSRVTDDTADLYGRNYWFSHMEDDLGFVNIYQRARKDLAERAPYWLRTLLRHRLPPGRVLEVGSAHGGFVALLAQAGFQATGLELSPAIVAIARELFGVPMLTGPVEDQAITPGSLDVIALMDVLEHLPDPVGSMRASVQALAPDGFLLIQTPAYPEGVSYAEMQATSSRFLEQLKANEHLYLFSKRSLLQFFAGLGCDHVTFESALFSHYDMFVVVGRQPALSFSTDEQVKALETASARLALGALDLYERAERAEAAFATADADRTARLIEMERIGAALVASEADRAARLEVIKAATARLAEVAHEMDALRRRIAELEAAASGLPFRRSS